MLAIVSSGCQAVALLFACTLAYGQVHRSIPAERVVASDGKSYSVFNSHAYVYGDQIARAIFWISADEILFVGSRLDSGLSASESLSVVDFHVQIWNVQTGVVRTLRDFGPDHPSVCFNDGSVLLRVRARDGTYHAYHGALGHIVEDDPKRGFSAIFCRPLNELPRRPAWMEGRALAWLGKANEGFLDFGETTRALENLQVRLYRLGSDKDEGIVLPFGSRQIKHRLDYYAFRDAFFVDSSFFRNPPGPDVQYPVYWLFRDGRSEKILDIPYGTWRTGIPVPVRHGVIAISHHFNARNAHDLLDAGMYLITRRGPTWLLKAWIDEVAVSSDGCRVAFAYAEVATGRRGRSILRAIDLCKEG